MGGHQPRGYRPFVEDMYVVKPFGGVLPGRGIFGRMGADEQRMWRDCLCQIRDKYQKFLEECLLMDGKT